MRGWRLAGAVSEFALDTRQIETIVCGGPPRSARPGAKQRLFPFHCREMNSVGGSEYHRQRTNMDLVLLSVLIRPSPY